MTIEQLPPLAALRAFAAYVETDQIVAAGAKIGVTHAAISQQLRALEKHLGVALLDRSGRTLQLTGEGQVLADAVTLGFGAISRAVEDITGADAARPVQVSCTAMLASAWLMPRLGGFRQKHPDIDLMLNPSPLMVQLEPGGIDVALRFGRGDWPGLVSEPLIMSPMVVVAAPSLVKGRTIDTPADLTGLPWLEEAGVSEATRWLQRQGLDQTNQRGRVQVPGNLLLDGARDGQGVAVIVRHFVERDIEAGRLVELFEDDRRSGYHIVTREGVLRPSAKAFVSWLRRQSKAQP
jgi:LysR family glycine cleavage system transcriptional activator